MDIRSVVTQKLNGRTLTWQGGGGCLAFSAHLSFASEQANILSEVLPKFVHVQNLEEGAALHWYLERMMSVLSNPRPGWALQGEYLAQVLFIEILKHHMTDETVHGVGWLFALADKQIGASIMAIHESPGHRWTVDTLAERAGMSRSAFSLRFKKQVGKAVMEYLVRWRMLLAADLLTNTQDSISSISLSLGYASESAFGFAFKRTMGCSPRQYCRERV